MKKIWIKSKALIKKIELVDRFLILFMLILLLYTVIGLFTGMTASQNGDMVDTIIRTSAAAIFGYFISNNFVKTNTANLSADSYSNSMDVSTQAIEKDLKVQSDTQNEFVISDDSAEEPVKESVAEISSEPALCSKLQVIIVSSMMFVQESMERYVNLRSAKSFELRFL